MVNVSLYFCDSERRHLLHFVPLLQAAPVAMHVCAGINHEWDIDLYGRLLETGGGKERMTAYFTVGNSRSHASSHA